MYEYTNLQGAWGYGGGRNHFPYTASNGDCCATQSAEWRVGEITGIAPVEPVAPGVFCSNGQPYRYARIHSLAVFPAGDFGQQVKVFTDPCWRNHADMYGWAGGYGCDYSALLND